MHDNDRVTRPRDTPHYYWRVPLAAICALMLAGVASGEPTAFTVNWQASALSVTAEKADIVCVLEAVRAETGIAIQGLERLEALPEGRRTVSVAFENLLLSDGLKSLLSGYNFGLVEFLQPKPGTAPVWLYIGQATTPVNREDEAKVRARQTRGASVTSHAQDEFGTPIASPDAPEQASVPSRPLARADETTAAQLTGAPSVTVNVEGQSGAFITPAAAPEHPRATSPARLWDEPKANRNAEPQKAQPKTPQ